MEVPSAVRTEPESERQDDDENDKGPYHPIDDLCAASYHAAREQTFTTLCRDWRAQVFDSETLLSTACLAMAGTSRN